jgi:hypothetical protein
VRNRIGTYLVVAALILTWPLHIGAFSYLVTELVGDFIAPHEDHVLFWFPIAAGGGVLVIALAAGIFMRYRWALYASAVVLLGGLVTVGRFFPRPSRDWTLHLYDWILCIGLAALCVMSAAYLLWLARSSQVPSKLLR